MEGEREVGRCGDFMRVDLGIKMLLRPIEKTREINEATNIKLLTAMSVKRFNTLRQNAEIK